MFIVAFDIDGTLTPIKSSWSYVHKVLNTLKRAESIAKQFFEGFISYDEWITHDLSLWKGLSLDTFNKILLSIPWRSGIESIRKLKNKYANDVLFIAVSGGFNQLGKRAVEELGFDAYIGVEIDYESNRLNGKAKFYPEYNDKGRLLKDLLQQKHINVEKIICVGDNINDIGLFRYCDISISFCSTCLDRYATYVIKTCNISMLAGFLDFLLSTMMKKGY